MIDDKIMKYRNDLVLVKKLANNKYANQRYYEQKSIKLEKLLKFYENLKIWDEISDK
ncbi:MAG: hypothetical protein ACFE8M_08350 [Candidatus Hermodarchaeota archaeon]